MKIFRPLPIFKIDVYCSDFSRHVEKSMLDLTPQPPSLQGKGEN